ncbi:hypothetical protein RSOLAG1IB_05964 [Rhizoctonia solani AG-1 IB]|uniref:Uncharacterized protein n=1 Tax=Thanatephorus cucumeris (strain AG1-IB / isolate 7/3/14) TaxID=1108050 RepID=A0A0B7F4A3_THACB|nr:hypothetical protein RSOLAG1IB_05964 [Rhizoctonia solani AG-1 IB]
MCVTDWEGRTVGTVCERPGDGYQDTETRGKACESGSHPCPVVYMSGGWGIKNGSECAGSVRPKECLTRSRDEMGHVLSSKALPVESML